MVSKFMTVPAGTIGFDIDSKRREAPKYRFKSNTIVRIVGEETRGCDEYAHRRLIVLVEGKRLSIRA